MEAVPPGSDQLPSWESRKSSEHAHASRGYTTQCDEGRRGGWGGVGEAEVRGEEGERAAFNIILGSGFNSVCVPVPIYCYLSGRQAAFHSCVITPQGGDQKYARQRNAPLCTLPGKATTFVGCSDGDERRGAPAQTRAQARGAFIDFQGRRKRRFPRNVTKIL